MLKTKSKFKLLLALGVMLLAVVVFNMNTVHAVTVNENSLNNVPSTIEVGIPTTQAVSEGFVSQELENIIKQNIKNVITDDMTDYEITVYFGLGSNNDFIDITNVRIRLYNKNNSTTVAEKEIEVVYNDKNYNTSDKQDIENKCKDLANEIEITSDIMLEFEEKNKIITEKLNTLINDDSIQVSFVPNQGDPDCLSGPVIFSKNNVIYFVGLTYVNIRNTITIPSDVENTEQAIMNYALPKLKEALGNDEITVTIKEGTGEYAYILTVDEDFDFLVIKEKNEITATNKETNIKLDAPLNVIPDNTVLETKEIKEEKTLNVVKESLKDVSSKYTTYDITLTSNGVAIQPNGKVKISIPIPTDYDKTKLAVYRVADNGDKIKYDVKVEGNFATIETDHFSTYVLAENNVTIADTNTNNQEQDNTNAPLEKDNTPKTGKLDIINYVLVVTALAGIGILTFKKYSK